MTARDSLTTNSSLGSPDLWTDPAVFDKLTELVGALGAGDWNTSAALQTALSQSDWADNGQWLMGIRRLIEIASKLGVTL